MVMASLCQDVGVHPNGGSTYSSSSLVRLFLRVKLLRKSRAQQLDGTTAIFSDKAKATNILFRFLFAYAGPYEVKRGRSVEKTMAVSVYLQCDNCCAD